MKTRLNFVAALVAIAALAACGEKPAAPPAAPPTADELRAAALANADKNAKLQDLLEQQRAIALGNVSASVAAYFAANPRFDSTWKTIPHTDDFISPSCPQGSGWAWASIMKVEGKDVQKNRVYCSTSSASVGCYIEADFHKSPYGAQAAKCDPNLPHPLKPFGGR